MAEPIRIAQVLNRMDSGGIEAVVMNYYRTIDRSKIQFDFYFEDTSFLPQRAELERLGAGVYYLPSYKRVFTYHKALCQAFREHRYTIVHAEMSTLSFFPLLAAWHAGVPVRICHNHTMGVWSEGFKTVFKVVLRPLCKLFATDWFACGEAAAVWMYGRKSFAQGKVKLIPNAIDLPLFRFNAESRRAVREEYGIPADAFVVGHVGRFVYQKNHEFLLKIFEQLVRIEPNARLLLIGEGELEEPTRRLAGQMGLADKVIFAGVRGDVARCYSAMDVFCLPSFYEGIPVVALEAQANGLPCLCSNAVSRETSVDQRFQQVSLDRPAEEWAYHLKMLAAERSTSLLNEHRMAGWDIHERAARLQQWYLRRSAQGQ